MIIGITGVFGCGKSTCIKLLKKFDLDVISADEICHQIYTAKNPSFIDLLKNRWNTEILNEANKIDRRKIAEIVFNNPTEMDFLSSILSPMIREGITAKINEYRAKNQHLFLEIPLLFEENYAELLDKTITIYASREKRISNLAMRNYTENDIIARDKAQLPLDIKAELADFVVTNNGTIEILEKQLIELLNKLNLNN